MYPFVTKREKIIKFIVIFVSLLSFTISSCSHYLDRTGSFIDWSPFQSRMQAYKDSNVVTFKSKMAFHADAEVWHARQFSTALPKGLKWYDFDYGTTYVFYYRNNQAIAIWIDIANPASGKDTSYVPTENEISNFIPTHLITSGHKYNIQYIPYISGRKQFMIQKKGMSILLYNITAENFEQSFKCVQTFTFL